MTSKKSDKGSPSKQEPTNIHPYPDWAAVQAYYGPGMPLPSPYMSSPMMPGHVPHPQMWSPTQGMMPPYGVPYQTVYPPGVVYAHPPIPLAAAPVSTQQPSKIPEATDRSFSKKVKKLETISTQVVNDDIELDDEGSSWSQEQGFDASWDKSDFKKDDRQVKREKRKQANRESARRSRMRKQAEVEELMEGFETLKRENMSLKSEIDHLIKESEKLRVENATLLGKLDCDNATRPEELVHGKFEQSIAQANHLKDDCMENNLESFTGNEESASETFQNSKDISKL